MIEHIQAWLVARRRKRLAVQQAVCYFRERRGVEPMGGHVLRLDAEEAIVRVMYFAGHIPPAREWFAISPDGSSIRELSFDDVQELESPWR